MRNIGQLFLGLLTAVASSLIVLSAASLALLEGTLNILPTPTSLPSSTPQPGETITLKPTEEQVAQPVGITVQPTKCNVPPEWTVYTVMTGDTLESLAEKAGISAAEIYQKNCLDSTSLVAGATLSLPFPMPTATIPLAPTAMPTATPTATVYIGVGPCQYPPTWIPYIVRSGDTLYRISRAYGITVVQLMAANCRTSISIYPGDILYVPNVVPSFPTLVPTRTPTETRVDTPAPTEIATITVTITKTPTKPPVPTEANTPTASPTPTETSTPTPTATATPTSTTNLPIPTLPTEAPTPSSPSS